MKYTVEGNIFMSKEIEAESPEEAVHEMCRRYPGVQVHSVDWDGDGFDLAGFCETCNKPLFYDRDSYFVDDEGCYACGDCLKKGTM